MRDQYSTLASAKEQLSLRQYQRVVVEGWWEKQGFPRPTFLPPAGRPAILLLRQVATARYEDILFFLMAQTVGLAPIWLEYTHDHFSGKSRYKRSLLQRLVVQRQGRQGNLHTRGYNLVRDVGMKENLPLAGIQVDDGRSLLDVHHALQDELLPVQVERHDVSACFQEAGFKSAKDFYAFVLSWTIAHGVLCEDFHGGESGDKLDSFVQMVVEPAWQQIVKEFDLSPLIVPLPWSPPLGYYPRDRSWHDTATTPELLFRLLGLTA